MRAAPLTASHSSRSSPSGSCTTLRRLPLPRVASANCFNCQPFVPLARFCGWKAVPRDRALLLLERGDGSVRCCESTVALGACAPRWMARVRSWTWTGTGMRLGW